MSRFTIPRFQTVSTANSPIDMRSDSHLAPPQEFDTEEQYLAYRKAERIKANCAANRRLLLIGLAGFMLTTYMLAAFVYLTN